MNDPYIPITTRVLRPFGATVTSATFAQRMIFDSKTNRHQISTSRRDFADSSGETGLM